MFFGGSFQFHATAGAESQDVPIVRDELGKKQGDHPLQVVEARHPPDRTFGVTSGSLGIVKRRHENSESAKGMDAIARSTGSLPVADQWLARA